MCCKYAYVETRTRRSFVVFEHFMIQRVGMSVRPGVCKPRSTTTKKDTGADCTACPDCVHCATIGGEATVKRGYARQPANSGADELSDSGQQSDSKLARQISIFKCQDTGACVGSNASLTRAATPEEECKEGFGGVARWAWVILGGNHTRCVIHGPAVHTVAARCSRVCSRMCAGACRPLARR